MPPRTRSATAPKKPKPVVKPAAAPKKTLTKAQVAKDIAAAARNLLKLSKTMS